VINIDDEDQLEQLEARGFRFAGLLCYNAMSDQVAMIWTLAPDAQERILRALNKVGGWRDLDLTQ
jgi:hypothetical protein